MTLPRAYAFGDEEHIKISFVCEMASKTLDNVVEMEGEYRLLRLGHAGDATEILIILQPLYFQGKHIYMKLNYLCRPLGGLVADQADSYTV